MKTNRHSTLLKKAVHLITYNSSHKLICLLGCLLFMFNEYICSELCIRNSKR